MTQTITKTIAVLTLLGLGACTPLGAYKMSLPQGTPLTKNSVQTLRAGMTQEQVLYVLGSPAVMDALNPNRWDYVYHYTKGTDDKAVAPKNHRLSVYFENGRLVRIEGLDSLPVS